MSSLYHTDFHAWANQQATLLRQGRLQAADIEHIAEEIESMGRSEKRELFSRLVILMIGFDKVQGYGFGLYPFPDFMQPLLERIDPWHCHQMAFVARK